MLRDLGPREIEILRKLAPELGDSLGPAPGHLFKFILLPVSHRIASSSEDFRRRLESLPLEDFEYLVGLVLEGREDIRSLAEGDLEAFLGIVNKRLSAEKTREIRGKLGLVEPGQ